DAFDPSDGTLLSATLTVTNHATVAVFDRNAFTNSVPNYRSFAYFDSTLYLLNATETIPRIWNQQQTDPFVLQPGQSASAVFNFEQVFTVTLDSPELLGWLMNESSRIVIQSSASGSTYFGQGTISLTSDYSLTFNYSANPVLSIRTSQVEICLPTESNRVYQVQYRSGLSSNEWNNLGGQITGNGTTNCLTDAVPSGAPQRFYRTVVR